MLSFNVWNTQKFYIITKSLIWKHEKKTSLKLQSILKIKALDMMSQISKINGKDNGIPKIKWYHNEPLSRMNIRDSLQRG